MMVWASCDANALIKRAKALNISRQKSEVDIHYENLLINRSLLKKLCLTHVFRFFCLLIKKPICFLCYRLLLDQTCIE